MRNHPGFVQNRDMRTLCVLVIEYDCLMTDCMHVRKYLVHILSITHQLTSPPLSVSTIACELLQYTHFWRPHHRI